MNFKIVSSRLVLQATPSTVLPEEGVELLILVDTAGELSTWLGLYEGGGWHGVTAKDADNFGLQKISGTVVGWILRPLLFAVSSDRE